jgi:hypothetical protein
MEEKSSYIKISHLSGILNLGHNKNTINITLTKAHPESNPVSDLIEIKEKYINKSEEIDYKLNTVGAYLHFKKEYLEITITGTYGDKIIYKIERTEEDEELILHIIDSIIRFHSLNTLY